MATLTLNDDLMARLKALANDAGQPVEAIVETLLENLVDQIAFEDGLPVHRMPPDAPPLTSEEVDRILNGSDE